MSMTGLALMGIALWIVHSIDPTQGTDFRGLIEHIEWNTILFVTSMMVIVSVAGASGMFQYIALTLARPSGGNTRRLFVTFMVFVWGVSLFFDTTSTLLIMGPLTIEVCKALEIDFKPFLIAEAIIANFASIPSIVGAVPNLVIASEVGLNAGLLFIVMLPLSGIIFIVSIPLFLRFFDKQLVPCFSDLAEDVFDVDPHTMIKSRRDFYASVLAIGILILGFTAGASIGIEPALVAIAVAFTMLLMSQERVNEHLSRIGWGTIFFLIGIFGLVAALGITGIIGALGEGIGTIIGDNVAGGVAFLTWIPAGLSAVIDNIPVSVVLAPVALNLAFDSQIFTFALIAAVNIGGYMLPIGAPANLMAMGLAEAQHDPISFLRFGKVASLLSLLHLGITTGWLLLMSFFI